MRVLKELCLSVKLNCALTNLGERSIVKVLEELVDLSATRLGGVQQE